MATTNTTDTKITELRMQIVDQLTNLNRDNIKIPICPSWPAGLSEAILEHYGKFAVGIKTDDKITHIQVNPKSFINSQKWNSTLKNMGVNSDTVPVINIDQIQTIFGT